MDHAPIVGRFSGPGIITAGFAISKDAKEYSRLEGEEAMKKAFVGVYPGRIRGFRYQWLCAIARPGRSVADLSLEAETHEILVEVAAAPGRAGGCPCRPRFCTCLVLQAAQDRLVLWPRV